ncbi:hypothetical protein JL720_1623 [Aureococcus anophagefferens]|nr:hypothetical protein JL720_1623 [Aureococcus anophagefferens]
MLVADCCGDAGCAQGQQVELAPPHTPPEHVVYAQARRVAGKRSRRATRKRREREAPDETALDADEEKEEAPARDAPADAAAARRAARIDALAASIEDRVQNTFHTRVVYLLVRNSGGPLDLGVAAGVAISLGMLVLSVAALCAVWITQAAAVDWTYLDDDAYVNYLYPAGMSTPSMTSKVQHNEPSHFGVPVFVFLTLLATVFTVITGAQGSLQNLVVSHCLLMTKLVENGPRRAPSGGWRTALSLFLAYAVYHMRILLLVVTVEQSVQIIGTSDGPLNILLNATALLFLVNLDVGFGVGPRYTSFGAVFDDDDGGAVVGGAGDPPCPAAVVARTVADAPRSRARLLFAAEQFTLLALAILILTGVVSMQRITSDAEMIVADDKLFADYPRLVNTYQVCQLLVIVLICGCVNVAAYCGATGDAALSFAAGILDFFLAEMFHVVVYEWAIRDLLLTGFSAKSHPIVWGGQRIYRTHQTGYNQYFGGSMYDDGAE